MFRHAVFFGSRLCENRVIPNFSATRAVLSVHAVCSLPCLPSVTTYTHPPPRHHKNRCTCTFTRFSQLHACVNPSSKFRLSARVLVHISFSPRDNHNSVKRCFFPPFRLLDNNDFVLRWVLSLFRPFRFQFPRLVGRGRLSSVGFCQEHNFCFGRRVLGGVL